MTSEIVDREWDVVIVGAGLGGGVVGRRLAEKGMRVLFLERGPMGPRAEQQELRHDIHDPFTRRIRGYWPTPLNATINDRQSLIYGAVGCGVGGSSAYYAATLERPERHDIDDSHERPHPTGGWPQSYDRFKDYFSEAERLFHVCGGIDPLSTEAQPPLLEPPKPVASDKAMLDSLRECGLHPYHTHMAVRFLPDCRMCFGRKCPRQCKMDGRSAGVTPALDTGNAALLDMCDVRALRGTRDRITHVEAEIDGEVVTIRAKRYVVASGGLGSPRLLLASRSEAWPNGCANSSGLVGRNLMFHLTELIAVWPGRDAKFDGPTKSIAMRDFYYHDGQRFGALQAIGLDASYGEIYHSMRNSFSASQFRSLWPIRELLRIPALSISIMRGYAKIFRGFIEDLPYEHNRVVLDEEDPGRLKFEYRIEDELEARRQKYRKLLKQGLGNHRSIFVTFQPELDFSHACGTVRFGSDREKSVTDENCRAHDIQNLYVADASFMPTSSGINPSLLVAANSLRVADAIVMDASEGTNSVP